MVNMPPAAHFHGCDAPGVLQQSGVESRMTAPRLGPFFQMTQLDAEDSRLQTFQPVIESLQLVVILLLRAPIPQHADFADVVEIVRRDRSAFAAGSQVL